MLTSVVSVQFSGDSRAKTSASTKSCLNGVGPTQSPHYFSSGRIIKWSRCISSILTDRGGLWPASSTLTQEILWSAPSPHDRTLTSVPVFVRSRGDEHQEFASTNRIRRAIQINTSSSYASITPPANVYAFRRRGDGRAKTSASMKSCPRGVRPTQCPHHFGSDRIYK